MRLPLDIVLRVDVDDALDGRLQMGESAAFVELATKIQETLQPMGASDVAIFAAGEHNVVWPTWPPED